ncbi:hypothetical protein ccbrp13_32290 [Ktedonobacteria bacterium brp13]|nr:hypothetical protein ccbrp13_32290 [Ktedonobacteria bacterium brp13]
MLATLTRDERDPGKISSYLVRYYGAHLEWGDAHPDLFDALVSEGWQRVWEALEGTYDGFLSGLMRAWKQAEAIDTLALSTQERSRAISRQCRYTLIVASINVLVSNIPPTLLKAFVIREMWTPIQGLAYARRISNEARRGEQRRSLDWLPTCQHLCYQKPWWLYVPLPVSVIEHWRWPD